MSEPKRFSMMWGTDEDGCIYVSPFEHFHGDWVRHADYANLKADLEKSDGAVFTLAVENERLKAEVERLEHQVIYWSIEAECDYGRWLRCLEDLDKLRASSFVTAVPCEHYERVVKAGDAMEKWIRLTSEQTITGHLPKSIKRWNAAKEGKPSV